MENNQLLPFERNRYYVGKLLTSADFQAEQTYMNQKRHFLNRMLYGDGVVCGLGVYNLDDMSIMVESGMGTDGLGREIIVDTSVVKKLSAVEGFETLESGKAILCLRYKEEAVHPVYAVRGQGEGEDYQCNRLRESYELFLQDAAKLSPAPVPESEFLSVSTLYADGDLQVEVAIPATVSCGHQVRMVVTATRRSQVDAKFCLDAVLQIPALTGPDGEHEVQIKLTDVPIPRGEPLRLEYWLTAQNQPAADTAIIAGAESIRVRVGQSDRLGQDNFMLRLGVEEVAPRLLVARAVGSVSLETREMAGIRDFIPLAELSLQFTKNAYLIDGVTQGTVRQFLHTPGAAGLRAEYDAWFQALRPVGPGGRPAAQNSAPGEEPPRYQDPVYATGVCEIPMGTNARKGQLFRSDEILHGLGKGNIQVQLGFEYLADDPKLGTAAKHTIFGNPDLFSDETPPISYADLGAKVMQDRGSFTAAARLQKDTTQTVLTLRWVAVRLPNGDDQTKLQRLAGKSIAAVQPTVVLATRESHFFNVKFKNMEPCTLNYTLTERDSGDITSDGVYTAPSKEGVYEIRISCADMPLISTYAYAVVKKRDTEEDTTAPAPAQS